MLFYLAKSTTAAVPGTLRAVSCHVALLTFVAAGALALVAAEPVSAQTGCVPIQLPSPGVVRLGIWNQGILGCQETTTPAGFASSNPSNTQTAIRHLDAVNGINNEGLSRSNDPTEGSSYGKHGWGLSYDSFGATPKVRCVLFGVTCGAPAMPSAAVTTSGAGTPPPAAMHLQAWDGAVSVTHLFTPSASPYLYQEAFTIEGLRTAPIKDVLVRQAINFYPEPATGSPPTSKAEISPHFITMDGVFVPAALRFSSNLGDVERSPLAAINDPVGPGAPGTWKCNGVAETRGPGSLPGAGTWPFTTGSCMQGAAVEFGFGDIAKGEGSTFFMYWGAAPTLALAREAVGPGPTGVDADFWFFVRSPADDAAGAPSVFIWAFSGFRGPEANLVMTVPPITYTQPWVPAGYRPPGIAADAACVGSTWSFRDTSLPRDWAIERATWDWGDGSQTTVDPYATGPYTHPYASTGEYTVTLTVTDANGNRASEQAVVRVVECPVPPPPNGCPSIDPLVARTKMYGQWVNFTAWAADHNPYSASDPLSFTLVVYPPPADPAPVVTPSGESLRVSWLPSRGAAGSYLFTITVTDGLCSATTDLRITVLGPDPDPPEAVPDQDRDGIADPADNCMGIPNRTQLDSDLDGQGDACDSKPCSGNANSGVCRGAVEEGQMGKPRPGDLDGDGLPDLADNCARRPNPDQGDGDLDMVGDACDEDLDGDGVVQLAGVGMAGALLDNCPQVPNQDQADQDLDGVGDACDAGSEGEASNCPSCPGPAAITRTPDRRTLPWGWLGVGALMAVMVAGGALLFALRPRDGP